MSNNVFSWRRFLLLWKQHYIHNTQFLLLSAVAYIGVIFIVLSIVQIGNDLAYSNLENFQGFMIGFVAIFGILYAGHSFPALRSKESTIHYLMVPASVPEKFLFEFISRIVIVILILPFLYWVTFHLQGYFFSLFTEEAFTPIGAHYMVMMDIDEENPFLIYAIVTASVLLAFVLAFTGAAMFTKQPLVKSLFAVAVIVMSFVGYSYIVITQLGISEYNPPDDMLLVPTDEISALTFITLAMAVTIAVMIFVAFRKLKEREV